VRLHSPEQELAVGGEVGELQTGSDGRFHAQKQRTSHNATSRRLRMAREIKRQSIPG